jgi:hypothetical protein
VKLAPESFPAQEPSTRSGKPVPDTALAGIRSEGVALTGRLRDGRTGKQTPHHATPRRLHLGPHTREHLLQHRHLRARQFGFQRSAGVGQFQLLHPPVMLCRGGDNQTLFHQFPQRRIQCLLAHIQHTEQRVDRHAGAAGNEVEDAVMDAPKAALRQDAVRRSGESAVGKKENLDGFAQFGLTLGINHLDRAPGEDHD